MTRYLLLAFFVATMGSEALKLDFGLAPGLSVKNAMLYAVATAIAAESAITHNRKVELLPVILPFVMLIGLASISWVTIVVLFDVANYPPIAMFIRLKVKLVDQFLVLLVFFYGVVKWRDALWLLKALIWVAVVACLVTVVDSFDVPDLGIITTRADGRVEGITGSSQEFGGLVAFLLPLFFALWRTATGVVRKLALASIVLALICILLSASRGAMLGVAAGAAIAAVYLRRFITARMVARASMLALALIAIVVLSLLSTEYGELIARRMSTGMTAGSAEAISAGRTRIWLTALGEMTARPWTFITGFGWEMYAAMPHHRLATHSVYLDLLYNLGIIGLALFLSSLANAIACTRRALRSVAAPAAPFMMAATIGMTSFVIAMMFSNIHGVALYVWAYMALALRIAVTTDRSAQPAPPADRSRSTRDRT